MDSSGRLQAESRQQRPGHKIFSVKALRIGRQVVASYGERRIPRMDGYDYGYGYRR